MTVSLTPLDEELTSSILSGQGHGLGQHHEAIQAGLIDPGQDSTNPAGMQRGLAVYCGYASGAPGYRRGSYSNMSGIKARFPGKLYLCVGTDCIDIETGLAFPSEGPGFVRQWKKDNTNKPVLYANASTMPAVKSALVSAGIPRSAYYLWVAEWNGGGIPSGYDAIQNGSNNSFDSDLFQSYMFDPVTPPPPPPPPTPTISVTPKGLARNVSLEWTPPPNVVVDHFIIICSPASPGGILRPQSQVRKIGLALPPEGPVTANIYAISTKGKVAGHGAVSWK